MTTEEPISAKGAAHLMGVDARTLRKFLRSGDSPFEPVGQGHRYEFTEREFSKLKKRFAKWNSKRNNNQVIEVEPTAPDPDAEELEVDEP